jgi:hypothetical protein
MFELSFFVELIKQKNIPDMEKIILFSFLSPWEEIFV